MGAGAIGRLIARPAHGTMRSTLTCANAHGSNRSRSCHWALFRQRYCTAQVKHVAHDEFHPNLSSNNPAPDNSNSELIAPAPPRLGHARDACNQLIGVAATIAAAWSTSRSAKLELCSCVQLHQSLIELRHVERSACWLISATAPLRKPMALVALTKQPHQLHPSPLNSTRYAFNLK